MSKPLVLICSVELESKPLLGRLRDPVSSSPTGLPVNAGTIGGRELLVVVGGMGKVNAAHALTVVLERHEVAGVVGFGVGGAYPGTGLNVGDVAVATIEHYGDEGVATAAGWMSCEGIGIPLHSNADRVFFNEFPVDDGSVATVVHALHEQGLTAAAGPFVTVSCCSGTATRAAELATRYGALCETMEGAAYAHVAAIYGVPYLEVRGISNVVEDRDLSKWRLDQAAEAAATAVIAVAAVWRTQTVIDAETLR